MIWYIEKSGEAKEIPEEVLKYKIENNEISGDTLAVNEEIKNWVSLKETALWKEYNSGGSVDTATNNDLDSASHKWRCPKCGNMINKEPCPYCSNAQLSENTSNVVDTASISVTKKRKNFGVFLVIAIVAIIVAAFALKNGGSKLNGQYIGQTAFSDNAIVFTKNGDFERYARTFGDWEFVTAGTYSLKDSSLILRCTDGRVNEFYYDQKSDTMMQVGTSDIYIRVNQ